MKELIYIIMIVEIIVILMYISIYFSKKISKIVEDDKKISINYKQNIIIGLTSGIMVLVLERIITMIVSNLSSTKINYTTLVSIISSILGTILALILTISFLICVINYLIYLGLRSFSK